MLPASPPMLSSMAMRPTRVPTMPKAGAAEAMLRSTAAGTVWRSKVDSRVSSSMPRTSSGA